MAAPRTFYRCLFGGLLVVSSLLSGPAAAQSIRPDTTVADTIRVAWHTSLPRLTVTATHLPTSARLAPARITLLDSTAIHESGASSVASLLDDRAGFHIRRYGTSGLATPALRGTGASQTALLLDGQRITNPQLGHLDLSLLPTFLLESVSVMHGPASPVHGSNAIGGAINLHSVRPPSTLSTRMTARFGAFGERGGSLLVGGAPTEATSIVAAADVRASDGDFRYTDDSRVPPTSVRRRNADRTRNTVYASLQSQVAEHHLRVSGWLTQAERGLAPTASTGPAKERQWDRHVRLWGRDRTPLGDGHLTVRALAQQTRLRYRNPAQNVDQTGRTALASVGTTLRYPVSTTWRMAAGLSGSYADAEHPKLPSAAHQAHLSAHLEGTARYGRLRLYPAVRVDAYRTPNDNRPVALSPRVGVNAAPVAAWPDVRMKVQFGRAFRVPTFNDRFWQPGGTPDLEPERSWGGDVSLRLDRRWGHIEGTLFGHWRRNQIVWRPTGRGYWSPNNVGRVRALGGELTAQWSFSPPVGDDVRAGLTYTVTDARNRSDRGTASYNEPLLYVPRDQLKSHSTFSWGPAALSLTARYTGRRPLTSDGSRFLSEYVLLDAQLQLHHDFQPLHAELAMRLQNVLDTEYQSVGGRPMPPRHAQVRLLLRP